MVAGQRGNYPAAFEAGRRALELLPEGSKHLANAHINLMIASMATRDFAAAFEHGWRGYDSAIDAETRATVVSNLASLALRRGRFTAARRGFIAALGMSQLERIALPALGGLALISAATRDTSELRRVTSAIERASATASSSLRTRQCPLRARAGVAGDR